MKRPATYEKPMDVEEVRRKAEYMDRHDLARDQGVSLEPLRQFCLKHGITHKKYPKRVKGPDTALFDKAMKAWR